MLLFRFFFLGFGFCLFLYFFGSGLDLFFLYFFGLRLLLFLSLLLLIYYVISLDYKLIMHARRRCGARAEALGKSGSQKAQLCGNRRIIHSRRPDNSDQPLRIIAHVIACYNNA